MTQTWPSPVKVHASFEKALEAFVAALQFENTSLIFINGRRTMPSLFFKVLTLVSVKQYHSTRLSTKTGIVKLVSVKEYHSIRLFTKRVLFGLSVAGIAGPSTVSTTKAEKYFDIHP